MSTTMQLIAFVMAWPLIAAACLVVVWQRRTPEGASKVQSF